MAPCPARSPRDKSKGSSRSSSRSEDRSRDRDRKAKGRRPRRDGSDSGSGERRGNFGNRRNRGRRGSSTDSDDHIREQRKKQERLARLRALQIEEESQANKAKAIAEIKAVLGTGNNKTKTVSTSNQANSGVLKGDQASERYRDLDQQGMAGEEGGSSNPNNTDIHNKNGTNEETEDGNNLIPVQILTEEEIRQAKELLRRDWKKKKGDVKKPVGSDDEEDPVADVFRQASSTTDVRYDTKKSSAPLTISLKPDDMDEEEVEIKKEEEKIQEAEVRGEDTLEAFMKNIETKAAKQDKTLNLAQHLQRHLPQEQMDLEEEHVSHNLVVSLEDIAKPVNNNAENNAIEEEGNDEEDEQFIQALKDMDRLKEDEEEAKKAEEKEEDRKSEMLSRSGGSQAFDEEDDDEEEGDCAIDYFAKKEKLAEKKNLKMINHSEIEYEPFRKNLYIESEDITSKSEADIDYFRKELGDIKIRGLECPRPIQNWYQCGLSDKILKVLIEKNKFEHPFAIQCQAIPVIMSGRDCIGIAETGSGKTLAYLLPLLRHILDQRPLADGDGPVGLIMVPTRELATQVYNDAKTFCKVLNLNCVAVFGGTGVAGQLSELKRGCEIVICTPGRMIDVLTTSNGKITNLRRVTYVVLDEADRMFDMGFEPQISRILANIRPDRQTVMFSATFPRNVETLAKKILVKPIEIVVGNRGQVGRNILQIIEVIEPEKKKTKLLEILGYWSPKGQILIFVDKQVEADNLFTELLVYGYNPLVLHGGQDQVDRQCTISDFKRGVKNLMISTSLSARGLDIKNLVLVINYSCPTYKEDYTHRIGRTGRAGNKGTAITFITPEEDKYAGDIIQALQLGGVDPPVDLVRLHERFMVKVRRGDAKEIRNRNLVGSGYRFTAEEMTRMIEFKNTMKSQFGVDLGNDDNMSTSSKLTYALTSRGDDAGAKSAKDPSKVVKDPKTKDAIRKAATRAATQAIQAGASNEEVLLAAQNAIKEILQRLKEGEVIGKESQLDQLYKARDEMLERDAMTSGSFNQVVEINDYPESTRRKVVEKEYLDMVGSLTQTQISVRGTHIEAGRKAYIGQKKLQLYIEGDDQYNVRSAAEELKKFCEDSALTSLTSSGGYTGYTGKY
jgi:ATP-dependent RNA helicase DDX46/PRP5